MSCLSRDEILLLWENGALFMVRFLRSFFFFSFLLPVVLKVQKKGNNNKRWVKTFFIEKGRIKDGLADEQIVIRISFKH